MRFPTPEEDEEAHIQERSENTNVNGVILFLLENHQRWYNINSYCTIHH